MQSTSNMNSYHLPPVARIYWHDDAERTKKTIFADGGMQLYKYPSQQVRLSVTFLMIVVKKCNCLSDGTKVSVE
jgi:hypothetical protein